MITLYSNGIDYYIAVSLGSIQEFIGIDFQTDGRGWPLTIFSYTRKGVLKCL